MANRKLEKQVKEFSKDIEKGDAIELLYEGESIARYDFTEWSIDSKTPLDWLRGALCFEISLKGRDESKATLHFTKCSNDEFEYSESEDLGKGKHRQIIIYKGKEVGYLISKEKNILAPIEESYVIPDVEKGLSEPTDALLEGKKGWIEFKVFIDNYNAAFAYVKQNFEQVAYLFEVGDYD